MLSSKRFTIVLGLLLVAIYGYITASNSYATIEQVLYKEGFQHIIEVITENEKQKYALVLYKNNEVKAVTLTKNLFGWQTGIVTWGSSTVLSQIPAYSGINGFSVHENKLVYGVINNNQIHTVYFNDWPTSIIPLKANTYRLWYQIGNVGANTSVKAYDKNQKLIAVFPE